MEKDSTCPVGRKQPQELGSEPSTGSPGHCWSLGAKCQDTASPQPRLDKGPVAREVCANIRSCSLPTCHLCQFKPTPCSSSNLLCLVANSDSTKFQSCPGPVIHAHASIPEFCCPI